MKLPIFQSYSLKQYSQHEDDFQEKMQQVEARIMEMLYKCEEQARIVDQLSREAQTNIKQLTKDFDNKLAGTEQLLRHQIEVVSNRIEETNKTIQAESKTHAQRYRLKTAAINKELKELRAQLIALENRIKPFEELPKQIDNLRSNMDGYKKKIGKRTNKINEIVLENQEKVDKFDETYASMVKKSNKGVGKMNSQK